MPTLPHLALFAAALLATVTALPASAAQDQTRSALPVTSVLFDSNRPTATGDDQNYELYSLTGDGTTRRLTTDSRYDSWWPKISPDRSRVLFQRSPAGVHDTDYRASTTWTMNLDGSDLRQILPPGAHGWEWQGHPEWSPDGTRIATMCGTTVVAICIVGSDGSAPRLITTKARSGQANPFSGNGPFTEQPRGGSNINPSWSPDGRFLVFVGCPEVVCTDSAREVYRIAVEGGDPETRLTENAHRDHDPYYSPDGTQIAFLKNSAPGAVWGIYAIAPDRPAGASISRERIVFDDGSINSKPGWSTDSQSIYFHRISPGSTLFNLWSVKQDGTGLTQLLPAERDPLLGVFGSYDNEFPVNSSH